MDVGTTTTVPVWPGTCQSRITPFQIYTDAEGLTCIGIEARILAHESALTIATKLGIVPSVIDFYESTFYDVRNCLGHPDYILTQVIGCRKFDRTHWTYSRTSKYFAYVGGSVVLEEILYGTPTARPETPEKAMTFLSDSARSTLRTRLAIMAVSGDESNQDLVMEQLRRDERLLKAGDGDSDGLRKMYEENIQAMVKSLPFTVGREDGNLPPVIREFDKSAVELRTSELHWAATIGAPELEAKRGKTFPDRSKAG